MKAEAVALRGAYASRMDRPRQPLTSSQHLRLIKLVEGRAPDLRALATDAVNQRWLSDEECEALSRVALDEFLAHLGPDDEPDREGVEADDLLGIIEMQRRSFLID